MSRKHCLKILMIMFPVVLRAEEMSLKDALSKWQTSPAMLRENSKKEETYWKKVGTYGGFLPKVEARATHFLEQKFVLTDVKLTPASPTISFPAVVPATVYDLNFSLPLFDGLANIERYRSASIFLEASNEELDWARFKGEREIVVLFYRALAAQTLKDVAAQNVRALEDHLHDTALFKKAGISTRFDVLRAEVQASEARSELMNAEDNVALAQRRLNEYLGTEEEGGVLSGKLPVLEEKILDIKAKEISARADLKALSLRSEAIAEQERAQSKHYLPKVSLIGAYDKYNNLNDKLTGADNFRTSYSLGVQLTWNLFDGFGPMARDKELIEQRFQAQKTLQLATLKAKSDQDLWQRKFHYFAVVYQSRLNDIKKSEESVRLAKEGRAVGTRTNTDFLDAEAELFRARAGAINAQIGAIEALVNYELSIGKKVFDF